MNDQRPKTLEEIREERRRERWNAFWTPFITLASVVSSVAMLMFLIKTCQERNLPVPIVPPTSPLYSPERAPVPAQGQGAESSPTGAANDPSRGRAERTTPAQ